MAKKQKKQVRLSMKLLWQLLAESKNPDIKAKDFLHVVALAVRPKSSPLPTIKE